MEKTVGAREREEEGKNLPRRRIRRYTEDTEEEGRGKRVMSKVFFYLTISQKRAIL